MAIPTKQRWIFYLIALALTLIAVKWAGGEDRAKSAVPAARPAERADRARAAAGTETAPAAASEVHLDRLEPRAPAQAGSDLFRSLSWQSLAQDEVRRTAGPPPPPPSPQAPPLPFSYMGKLIEGGKTTAFLTKEDRNYIVRPGDTLWTLASRHTPDGGDVQDTIDEIVIQEIIQDKIYLDSSKQLKITGADVGGGPPELDLTNL